MRARSVRGAGLVAVGSDFIATADIVQKGTRAIRVVRAALRAARGMQLRPSKFDSGSAS
jgi:hypothetical protein